MLDKGISYELTFYIIGNLSWFSIIFLLYLYYRFLLHFLSKVSHVPKNTSCTKRCWWEILFFFCKIFLYFFCNFSCVCTIYTSQTGGCFCTAMGTREGMARDEWRIIYNTLFFFCCNKNKNTVSCVAFLLSCFLQNWLIYGGKCRACFAHVVNARFYLSVLIPKKYADFL